jgi:exodeoxyribonuclease V alpha subunit
MSEIEYAHIDHLFAYHLLKTKAHPLYDFCMELMKSSREGHLFIEKDDVDPSIEQILERKPSPIIKDGNAYYLERNFFHEQEIAAHLKHRMQLPKLSLNIPCPQGLNPGQQRVFEVLNSCPFFLITGGPGSGKSFVAKSIIGAYKQVYPNKKIICTAPTGKALSALSETFEESATIHKLLGIKEGFEKMTHHPPIIADLLIVDECSMISPNLFNLLLSSLLDITQVIFIGDPYQLPPVSGASIFYDFTTLSSLPNVTLSAPMRSDKQSIIDFSNAILHEDEALLQKILEQTEDISLKPLEAFDPKKHDKRQIILTPFRKGPYGSLKLNEQIHSEKDEVTPILITKNDKVTHLTNGDIGYINGDIALFPEKNITLPKLMLPSFEKAFALSIHKSQGSEFEHVLLILPVETTAFPKELLYTAVTRAKKSIQIYGSFHTLATLIKSKKRPSSNLKNRLLFY